VCGAAVVAAAVCWCCCFCCCCVVVVAVAEGVSVVKEMPLGLVMKVAGDINAVLKKLAAYNVKDISISQASLEEIFLEFYE